MYEQMCVYVHVIQKTRKGIFRRGRFQGREGGRERSRQLRPFNKKARSGLTGEGGEPARARQRLEEKAAREGEQLRMKEWYMCVKML